MIDIIDFAEKVLRISPAQLLFNVLSRADVQAYIINLNTEDQLKTRNEDSLGVKLYKIGGEYSIKTQFLKQTKAQNVTLYDTGDYYESYAVIPLRNAAFDIVSNTTIHGDDLKDRWGDNIEGLNNENLKKAKIFIEEKIIEELESLL